MVKIDLNVKGMHCKSCGILIADTLLEMPGVTKVTADHTSGAVHIECADSVPAEKLKEAMRELGYTVG